MYTMLTAEVPHVVKVIFLVIYILGFIFCIFMKGVVKETNLARSSKKTQYMVLFMVWLASPAVLIGLLILTFKTMFSYNKK